MVERIENPWLVPADVLFLSKGADRWHFAVWTAAGRVLDGSLDVPADVDLSAAQRQLIDLVERSTGLTYSATWQQYKPDVWTADLTVLPT